VVGLAEEAGRPENPPERQHRRRERPAGRRQGAADRPDLLLQLLPGVPVGLVDRPGGLPKVVELAELVRHPREHLGHRRADRVPAVRDDGGDRHRARGPYRGQELGGVWRPGGQETSRQ
jgi:hypothetical protein